MIKIAFVGAQSTGKTSTMKAVERQKHFRDMDRHIWGAFGKITMIEEIARICPMPVNRPINQMAQEWMLLKQLELESFYEGVGGVNHLLLCDRSVLDYFIYYGFGSNYDSLPSIPELPEISPLYYFGKVLSDYIKTYSLILFFGADKIELIDDGERSMDVEFRKEIDKYFKEYLYGMHNVLEVPAGDIETRASFVLDEIDKVMYAKGVREW